jgi:menaquinone-dependent protoporphyrinogen oxidase
MAKKVLIAYDSLFGSTKGVAEYIGKTLTEIEIEADVKNVSEVSGLTGYDAVVVGSPIVRGLMLDSTLNFLKQYESSLQKTPLAVFCVCMSLIHDNTHNRFTIMQMLKTIVGGVAKVNPVSWMGFAGAMDMEKLDEKARERFTSRGVPSGDWRNWDAIREWTLNLPSLLFTAY